MALLQVRNLSKHFAGVVAAHKVSFALERGMIMGMIGPNGAGKSTVFRMIAGFYKPDEGSVTFDGKDITGFPPYEVCRAGIAMTSQTTMPFLQMTVLQSTMAGSYLHCRDTTSARRDAYTVLEYIGLDNAWGKRVRECNISDRKKVELARALATRPKLLLLDEFMAGLNPQEVDSMMEKIRQIRKEKDITLLFVEHLMQAVMTISEQVVVLDHGELIATGEPKEVSRDQQVITAYLGKHYRAAG